MENQEVEQAAVFQLKEHSLLVQKCDQGFVYTIYGADFKIVACGILKQLDFSFNLAAEVLLKPLMGKGDSCERMPFQLFCERMQMAVNKNPKTIRDNRALEGQTCLFDTHRSDSTLMKYDGQFCKVLSRLREADYDFLEVGTMWAVEMTDGNHIEVFADEVNIVRTPEEFETYMESIHKAASETQTANERQSCLLTEDKL